MGGETLKGRYKMKLAVIVEIKYMCGEGAKTEFRTISQAKEYVRELIVNNYYCEDMTTFVEYAKITSYDILMDMKIKNTIEYKVH